MVWRDSRHSWSGRVGATGAAATDWASDTAVVCMVAAGTERSMAVVLSMGHSPGTLSEAATYDGAAVSSAGVRNWGWTVEGRLSLSGAGLGKTR